MTQNIINFPVLFAFRMLNKIKLRKSNFLILSLFCISANAGAHAQTITIKLQGIELRNAITEIEKQTPYRFLFNDAVIPADRKIMLDARQMPLNEFLKKLFENTSIAYSVTDNNLIILKNRSSADISLPDRTITGSLKNETGEALSGATVLVRNSPNGVSTDASGFFSIQVPENAVLVFSAMGYESMEIPVTGRTDFNLILKQSTSKMDEVLVIGYGTAKKRNLTGSTISIKGSDIINKPFVSPIQSVQGLAAGVQIIGSSAPGSAPEVRIRGTGSILGGVEPLYVVDGILTGDIRNINAADILSLDILKDASSTAIYGVRAANGVVIITTKSGRKGKMNIQYDGFVGMRRLVNKVPMAQSNLYAIYSNEAASAIEITSADITAKTDWMDEVTRNAFQQNHTLSMSGGSDKVTYYFSGGYLKEEGILKGNDYERINLRLNNEYFLNKSLKIGNAFSVSRFLSNNKPFSVFTQAYNASPIFPPKLNDSTFGFTDKSNVGNPLATLNYTNDKSWGTRLQGTIYGELKFLKNFQFNSSFGIDAGFNNGQSYIPVYAVNGTQRNDRSVLSVSNSNQYNWVWDNYFTYAKKFADVHSLKVTVGHTAEKFDGKFMSGSKKDIPPQSQYWSFDYGDPLSATVNYSNLGQYGSRESFFGRINYDYDNRFLLNASLRRDGASKFAENNRWAWFPAVGVGWLISNEKFMENNHLFNDLKFRASYGWIGNDNILPGQFAPQFQGGLSAPFGNNLYPGSIPVDVIDPNLKWEVTQELDLGIEFSVLNKRLTGVIDYYNKKVNDALYIIKLPATLGDDSYITNAANISNKGFEFTLGWNDLIGKNWTYAIRGNATFNQNNVENIGVGQAINDGGLNNGWLATQTLVNQPIGSFWVFKTDGIFQPGDAISLANSFPNSQPGDFRIVDGNKDGVIDNQDRVHAGSYQPKMYFGLNGQLGWNGFDFNLELYGNFGNKIFNGKKTQRSFGPNYNIEYNDAINRWQPGAPSDNFPRASNNRSQPIDWFLESGSFVRLNNVTIGYSLKKSTLKRMHIASLRMYASAQNAFTWKKYSGYTPELPGSPLNAGIELNAYPTSAIYTIGFNIQFQ